MLRPRRTFALVVLLVAAVFVAVLGVRTSVRTVLQHRAFRTGPAPTSIHLTRSDVRHEASAKTVRVASIDVGFPVEAISVRPQNSPADWTVVDLASGGVVAIVPPIRLPGPEDEFDWTVEAIRCGPRGWWTLMWMSREAFNEHLARVGSARVLIMAAGGADYEVLSGDGVKAIVCSSADPRAAHARIWFDGFPDPIALNIFDVDSPQELARAIIARSKLAP